MSMVHIPQALILVAFSFGAAIFYSLLGVERSVWPIAWSKTSSVYENDLRLVHRSLQGLSSYLPPSNGVVLVAGLTGLIWQGAALQWSLPSIVILGVWATGQFYIIVFGKIVQAVNDLRRIQNTDPIGDLREVVSQLIRQHFNGFLHASITVVLEIALIVSR
jgi:hypothetical protein